MAGRFMAAEAIILRLISLISIIVFSNVVSGWNFDSLIILFILICSRLLSHKVIADRFLATEAILLDYNI